jgi:purine-binding chemotaxis protein CheW
MADIVRSPARDLRRANDGGKRIEYLAFTLGSQSYAVPIQHIAEILKPPPITEIPRAPRNVVGIISVRGKLVTVVDLRRRFGLIESPFDRRTRILLTDTGDDEPIGLLVDEVRQVYRLAEHEIEPAAALGGDQPAYIFGIGRQDDALLVLLELKALIES